MSLYEELAVPPDADADAIKAAYRAAAKRAHPDNAETGDRDAFERVARAYLVLSDPQKRARYDESGDIGDNGEAAFVDPAEQLVVNHFAIAVSSCRDHGKQDIVNAMIASMQQLINDQQRSIFEAKHSIKKMDDVANRLSRSEGKDFLRGMIERDKAAMLTGIDDAQANIATHMRAIEIAKTYSYRIDEKPKAQMQASFAVSWSNDCFVKVDI